MSRFSLSDWFENGDARVRKFILGKAYSRNAWVYSCVRAIGNSIAGIPLLFVRPDDTVIEDRNEEPYSLLLKPSTVFDPAGASLIRDTVMLQELRGFAFWALEVKNKRVVGITLKRPETIVPVVKDEELLGWKEIDPTSRTQKRVYLPDEIIVFKEFSPDDKQMATAPLEASRLDLEQDFNMSAWNAAFFQSGAKKDIKIEVEKPMNRAQRRQFLKEITESRRGTEDAHGYLLLTGGAKGDVMDTGVTELAFKESRHLTREAICAAFGVPPAVVGIFRYANYANAREQRKIFWEQTLIPKMNQMADIIQMYFLDKWFGGYSCMWDYRQIKAFKTDVTEQAQAAKAYFDMGYSREEIAVILDAPELAPQPEEPEEQPEEPVVEESAGVYVSEKQWWNDYSEAIQDIVIGAEKRWIRAYKGFTDAMVRSVKKRFEKGYRVPLHEDEWRVHWIETVKSLGEQLWTEAGQIVLTEEEYAKGKKHIGYAGVIKDLRQGRYKANALNELLTEEEMQAFVTDMNGWLSKVYKLSDDTVASLNSVVLPLYQRGTSMAELTEELAKWNGGQYNKAMVIARNISHSGFNAARFSMFGKRGVLTHRWVSSNDPYVRETHVLENTHEVKFGEPFPVTRCRYPHDPNGTIKETINCRCTTVATAYKERNKIDIPKEGDLSKPVETISKEHLVKRVAGHKMFDAMFAEAEVSQQKLMTLNTEELSRLEQWLDMQAVRGKGLSTKEKVEFRPAKEGVPVLPKWDDEELEAYRLCMEGKVKIDELPARVRVAFDGFFKWEATTSIGNYTTGRVIKVYDELGEILGKLNVSPMVTTESSYGTPHYGASPMSNDATKAFAGAGLVKATFANKKTKIGGLYRHTWEKHVKQQMEWGVSHRDMASELEQVSRSSMEQIAVRTTRSASFFNRLPKKGDIVDTPYCSAGPAWFNWGGDTKIIFKLPDKREWWDDNVLFVKVALDDTEKVLSSYHKGWYHPSEEEIVLRNYWKISKTGKLKSTKQRYVVLEPVPEDEVAKMAHKETKATGLTGYIHRPVQTLEELEAEEQANNAIREWAKAHWKQAKKDMPGVPDNLIMGYLTQVYPNYVAPSG